MDTLDRERVPAFFAAVTEHDRARGPKDGRPASIAVTHLLSDRPFFIEALGGVTRIASVLPKPKTYNYEAKGWLKHRIPIHDLNRSMFEDPSSAIKFTSSTINEEPVVLLDIGGYFSESLTSIARYLKDKLIGVIEDTENGLQRYERISNLPCPVYHVRQLLPTCRLRFHMTGIRSNAQLKRLLRHGFWKEMGPSGAWLSGGRGLVAAAALRGQEGCLAVAFGGHRAHESRMDTSRFDDTDYFSSRCIMSMYDIFARRRC